MVDRGVSGASVLLAVLVAMVACDDDSQEPPSGDLPAAEGSALWSYLQEQAYATNWNPWPGKGEKYVGTQPHGVRLTTYVNNIALEALQDGATALPDGAIVVKENSCRMARSLPSPRCTRSMASTLHATTGSG
jgi:hypothetical protein